MYRRNLIASHQVLRNPRRRAKAVTVNHQRNHHRHPQVQMAAGSALQAVTAQAVVVVVGAY